MQQAEQIVTSAADELRAAKRLIEDPNKWCQNTFATTIWALSCHPRSVFAVRWCAVGALTKTTNHNVWAKIPGWPFLCDAARSMSCNSPSLINDKEGHARVLEMYERAIRLAEEKEAKP